MNTEWNRVIGSSGHRKIRQSGNQVSGKTTLPLVSQQKMLAPEAQLSKS
jgi:hypothetical protein